MSMLLRFRQFRGISNKIERIHFIDKNVDKLELDGNLLLELDEVWSSAKESIELFDPRE